MVNSSDITQDAIRQATQIKAPDAAFSAVLTPYRSLSPAGFVLFMALVTLVSFAAGMAFLLMGAWPVFGFFGLDVLLIYGAFKLNYRAGRLYELIELTGDELLVRRVQPSGQIKAWSFNPYWVRLGIHERPGRQAELRLSSHGQSLVVGSFLSEDEKRDFASALTNALHAYRGGTRI